MAEMNREQKEHALIAAANKADKTSQGFFLYHLGFYGLGAGKIRDLLMKMSDEDFKQFYEEEMENLKASEAQEGKAKE